MSEIIIFRYGHRLERDRRVTTHTALVSRAFGANKFIYSGDEDPIFENSVSKIQEKWGNTLKLEFEPDWQKRLEELKDKYTLVHLTMYGMGVKDFEYSYKPSKKGVVLIIGSQKVPVDIHKIADYNLSVTNQPHSEIASLAIALDRINTKYLNKDFDREFFKGKEFAKPSIKGKARKKN